TALDWARTAHRLFASQQRAWWKAQAAGVLVHAKHAAGLRSARLLQEAVRAAAQLESIGSADAARAQLPAGRVARGLGLGAEAARPLMAAARSGLTGPPLTRASGWLSEALRAEADAQPRSLLHACRRGLAVLDEHRYTLGSSELRAQATAH